MSNSIKSIKIEEERVGFPVKLGEISLWIDTSDENLKRLAKAEEIAKKRMDELMQGGVADPEQAWIATQYDVLFGDGTFAKLYAQYPDLVSLAETLDTVGVAISQRIRAGICRLM